MEDIILKESLIFSKNWKEEDVIKIIKFDEDKKNNLSNEMSFGERIEDDEKLDLNEYSDLIDKFFSIFIQKEIDQLNNDIKTILDYFYLRELQIEQYITDKYHDDKKRHLNIRLADYYLGFNLKKMNLLVKIQN